MTKLSFVYYNKCKPRLCREFFKGCDRLPPLSLVLLAVILVGLIALGIALAKYKMKKATAEVIEIFRVQQALDPYNAKTKQELGLAPKGILERAFKPRDYKVYAFDMLSKLEIIREAPEEKYYLSEQALHNTNIKNML